MNFPVLVFDGDCGFCRRCADWIAARLPGGTHIVAAAQADLAALGLSAEQAIEAAWWVDTNGEAHRGHRAIAKALVACGGGWGLLGRLLTAPVFSPVAAGVYEAVARNRHRLGSGCRNCQEQTQRGGPAFDS